MKKFFLGVAVGATGVIVFSKQIAVGMEKFATKIEPHLNKAYDHARAQVDKADLKMREQRLQEFKDPA